MFTIFEMVLDAIASAKSKKATIKLRGMTVAESRYRSKPKKPASVKQERTKLFKKGPRPEATLVFDSTSKAQNSDNNYRR